MALAKGHADLRSADLWLSHNEEQMCGLGSERLIRVVDMHLNPMCNFSSTHGAPFEIHLTNKSANAAIESRILLC